MFIIWFVLIGVIAYVLLAKSGKRISDFTKSGEDPVDTLKKRFVSGEITEEEYKKMLKIVND